jgi:hypothetical protein
MMVLAILQYLLTFPLKQFIGSISFSILMEQWILLLTGSGSSKLYENRKWCVY